MQLHKSSGFLIVLLALVISPVTALAASTANPGTVDAFGTTWHDLRVGAGGWLVGMDIAQDGTKVVRTDTYGAYLWNGTQWQQLITASSMPTSLVNLDHESGVMEIRIAPSNTNIFYMEYLGYVFKTTNRGSTWTQTTFSKVADTSNDGYRTDGEKMAIDPANPNIVYAGTEASGVFVTKDGGTTWTKISAIPAGSGPGVTGIAFNPTSGTTGGATNTIYIASAGNGVYVSTNAGSTWTKTSGGPSTVDNVTVSSDGIYYAAGSSGFWSYSGGIWKEMYTDTSGQGPHAIAVDPANPSRIIGAGAGATLNVSMDKGVTWTGWVWGGSPATTRVATDIPWLAWTDETYLSTGNMIFDPSASNKLFLSEGIGVWYANYPTSGVTWQTGATWNSQSAGIEQLVADEIISPPGGSPLVFSWDRPVFDITNPDVYPLTHGPNRANAIIAGWSGDWASSKPSFIVGDMDFSGYTEESGYSTDGGQTWTNFASYPPGTNTTGGGSIAAASPTDIVWLPAHGGAYYTQNGGTSWTAVTGFSNSGWAYYLDRQVVAADRVNIGTFYVYGSNGVSRSVDGGITWTNVHAVLDGGGLDSYNAKIRTVPGKAGELFFTGGQQTPETITSPSNEPFWHSTDGGTTWTAVSNVKEVYDIGFGKPLSGTTPVIYIVGFLNNQYGIYMSTDDASSWMQIGLWPINSLDGIKAISGDMNTYGRVYVGFGGSGYMYGDVSGVSAPPPTTQYTMTVSASSNGTISPSTTSVNSGSSQTFTITPNAGYEIASVTVDGASQGAISSYTFNAVNANHTIAASFSAMSDTQAPSTPANLSAAAVSSSAINLTWSASTDNVGVTGYKIYRGATQIATVTTTSYSDTNLSAATSYSYTVSAYDAAGNNSAQSGSANAMTQSGPVTSKPTVTFSATPTSITSGQPSTLAWSSTNATSCTGTGFTASAPSGSISVTPSQTTTYSIACTGTGGSVMGSASVAVSAVPTPPTTSGNISIGSRVDTTNRLSVRSSASTRGPRVGIESSGALGSVVAGPNSGSGYTWWQISWDNGLQGWSVQNYLAAVTNVTSKPTVTFSATPTSITSGQPSTLAWSSTNATSCTGTGFTASAPSGSISVTPSQTTTYSIACTGTGGSVMGSASVAVSAASDMTPPSTPANLSAAAVSSSAINLTWSASTDNVGVTGYKIYRGATQIATVTTTSYSDTNLSASTAYSYTVSAYDAAGNNSAQSGSASAMTQSQQVSTPPMVTINAPTGQLSSGTDSTMLSVTTSENAICKYATSTGVAYGAMTAFSTTGTLSHTTMLSGLSDGSSYMYYVACADVAGDISTSTPVVFSVASASQSVGSVSWTLTASPASQKISYANNIATFKSVNIGTPSSDRIVVIAVAMEGSFGSAPASVSIGAVAATKASGSNEGKTNGTTASLWYARVPSGTSADVVVTESTAPNGCCTIASVGIEVGDLTGAILMPTATKAVDFSYTIDPQVIPITVPSNGIALTVLLGAATQNKTTWSNATLDSTTATAGTGLTISIAHTAAVGAQIPTVNGWSWAGTTMVAAAWGPANTNVAAVGGAPATSTLLAQLESELYSLVEELSALK